MSSNTNDTVHMDLALTLAELAQACCQDPAWVVERVAAGLLGQPEGDPAGWRFSSTDLIRARRLAQTERMFDVNAEAAAFIADLIEEVQRLRGARWHSIDITTEIIISGEPAERNRQP